MSEKLTIKVDQNSALARHIEDLQRVITKRNERIAELEFRLSGEGADEYQKRLQDEAYADGWRDANYAVASLTQNVRNQLDAMRNASIEATHRRRERP